jgi:hypothetical protein
MLYNLVKVFFIENQENRAETDCKSPFHTKKIIAELIYTCKLALHEVDAGQKGTVEKGKHTPYPSLHPKNQPWLSALYLPSGSSVSITPPDIAGSCCHLPVFGLGNVAGSHCSALLSP